MPSHASLEITEQNIKHSIKYKHVQTETKGTRWAESKHVWKLQVTGTAFDHCEVFNRKMVLAIKQHWNVLGGNLRDSILTADLDLVANCCIDLEWTSPGR